MYRTIKALLAESYGTRPLAWTVLTFGTQGVRLEESVQACNSSLHGLVGSMAKEYRHWAVSLVDVGAADEIPWSALARWPPHSEGDPVAWRGSQWYRRQLRKVGFERSPNSIYKEQGLYWSLGVPAVWVKLDAVDAGEYRANVVWVGRRAADDGIEAACERLRRSAHALVYPG